MKSQTLSLNRRALKTTRCNLHIIWARIRHMIKDPHIQHVKTAEVYSAYSSSRECQIRSRSDQTLLAKLRTGKYKGLRAYKSLLDGSDPTCPLCNQEPQDIQHRLQRCQATEKLRLNLFGKHSWGLDCLTKLAVQAVALVSRTLFSGPYWDFY